MDTFLFALAILLCLCMILLIGICLYAICLDTKIQRYMREKTAPFYVIDSDESLAVDTRYDQIQPKSQKDVRIKLNEELNQSRNFKGRFREFPTLRVKDEIALERQRQPDSGLPPTGFGRLSFSLRYVAETQALVVHLLNGRQISSKGGEAAKWPVVNIRLNGLIDSEQQSTPDESTNPEYDQEFTFDLPNDKVGETSVLFTVWDLHTDMQKTNIGYVKISLGHFIESLLSKDGTGPLTRDIRDTEIEDIPKRKNGDILFSLSYHKESDCLSVAILRCKGVRAELEDTGLYSKVTLLVDGWPHSHRKTTTRPKQSDPMFKQILNFQNCIADDGLDIAKLGLAVSLRAKTLTGHKRVLGRVFLGTSDYSTPEGKSHWAEMIKSSRSAVAQWHPLEY